MLPSLESSLLLLSLLAMFVALPSPDCSYNNEEEEGGVELFLLVFI